MQPFENNLILNWGRSVQATESFKKLKVLVLMHFEISFEVLGGLNVSPGGLSMFPALTMCGIHPCHGLRDLPCFMREEQSETDRDWHILHYDQYVL